MRHTSRVGVTFVACLLGIGGAAAKELHAVNVRTTHGLLSGAVSGDGAVRSFKGIPYAAPPVGPLRWKPPQPAQPWEGVRPAIEFGPRAMQVQTWSDMLHRDPGTSEDCLYLNVWTPAKAVSERLPVMVWIHGGGFIAGSGSERRQDGENLSRLGVVVVNLNYRLGVFGFLAHPEFAAESEHGASGNYGLLDCVAALEWVRDNIGAFGGDPGNVTIFGQSAGSTAVCGLVASPLSRGLFHKAIGMSGSFFNGVRHVPSRETAGQRALDFVRDHLGGATVGALREMPAAELLEASLKAPRSTLSECVDGWFMPEPVPAIFAGGRQAQVPLLAGWTLDEEGSNAFFKGADMTLANFGSIAHSRFRDNAPRFLAVYEAGDDAEAERAAADFETDRSQGFRTWKWIEAHSATGSPVYRYKFDQTSPLSPGAPAGSVPRAYHSSDIEFVFRVLEARDLPWRREHREVSETMAAWFVNFAKHGDPNGPGLPEWPRYSREAGDPVMHIRAGAAASPDPHRARYEFLDSLGTLP